MHGWRPRVTSTGSGSLYKHLKVGTDMRGPEEGVTPADNPVPSTGNDP